MSIAVFEWVEWLLKLESGMPFTVKLSMRVPLHTLSRIEPFLSRAARCGNFPVQKTRYPISNISLHENWNYLPSYSKLLQRDLPSSSVRVCFEATYSGPRGWSALARGLLRPIPHRQSGTLAGAPRLPTNHGTPIVYSATRSQSKNKVGYL